MQQNQQTDIVLIFFSVAFFIVVFGLFSRFVSRTQRVYKPVTAVLKPTTVPKKRLNYDLPVTCAFANKEASFSAYMEGTSISLSIRKKTETIRILILGDCMYTWKPQLSTGQKQCGIGKAVVLGKQLVSSGLADAALLDSFAKKIGKETSADVTGIIDSCKNGTLVSEESFRTPIGVQFAEQMVAK